MELKNKVAVITGASVGIGRATAILTAQKGAKLVLFDIDFEKLEKLKNELSEYTKDVIIKQCDVSNEEQVNECISDSVSEFGAIDILVNNAALWRSFKPFLESTTEEWKMYFDVNVFGVMYMTKAVLPHMINQKYGRIINVSSVAGYYGNGNMVNYSSTKGAVISMSKALAKEVTELGITVNSVSPGTVSPSDNYDIDFTQASQLTYAGRTGSGKENAELICFLASDAAGYISGQNILIDGCRKKI